ncbi:tripartite tricarboxylate transporter TctB family protein [Halalkalibacterium halodurans]|uniref:tripartite tricarboxylate transporter TctB family protein n=1 Tax=Halalkalibacterium halodurans TaxID=86665 RepID=UPI001375FB64|nr:tripartite tricarboxylate transporter TctB family protein [Halalkalibacterium halodurans]MED4123958.1 tripartite tricarboxylate transporter TctB family protein [Halalkalibacterium halodurans]
MLKVGKSVLPSLAAAAFGVIILLLIPNQVSTAEINQMNARFFPYLLAIGIILLSVLSITIERTKFRPSGEGKRESVKRQLPPFAVLLGSMLWVILIPYLGFTLTTFFTTLSFMIILGNRKKLQLLFVPIAFTVTLYYSVVILMRMSVPQGMFF